MVAASMKRTSKNAFTLIELLIVITILTILACVVGPVVARLMGDGGDQVEMVEDSE